MMRRIAMMACLLVVTGCNPTSLKDSAYRESAAEYFRQAESAADLLETGPPAEEFQKQCDAVEAALTAIPELPPDDPDGDLYSLSLKAINAQLAVARLRLELNERKGNPPDADENKEQARRDAQVIRDLIARFRKALRL